MKNKTDRNIFVYLVLFLALNSCKEPGKKQENATAEGGGVDIAGYDLAKGAELSMKKKLAEISGIHYLTDDALVAIQDEKGTLYTVNLANGDISDEYTFGGPGDYEDVTMDANFYYVLESSGKVYRISRKDDGGKPDVFSFPTNKNMEFETIYLDPAGEKVILICKQCQEGKDRAIHAYAFSLKDGQFTNEPVFSLDWSGIGDRPRKEARPSAAAIHPVSRKLYVLCSVGKLLLVCSQEGKIETAFPLEPSLFNQPEGITFSPNGDMFISNEGGKGSARIIKFSYKR